MSRFGSQIKKLMKLEIRTLTLMLCAALMLTTACKKTPIPTEDPQPSVVEFCTKSQAAWVKTQSEPQTEVFPYDNFGVWGMARQEADGAVYNLWGNTALAEVSRNQETNLFEPTIAAYWLRGYAYRFIAVAPYNDAGYTFGSVTPATSENAVDKLTFTYDLSGKYSSTTTYTFDLLGAAADTDGAVAGGRTDSQDMTFWHLLSKINLTIQFGKDAQDNQINAVVDAIRLSPISRAVYNLSYNSQTTESTAPLVIECTPDASATKPTIAFDTNAAVATVGPIHVIPQNVATVDLEIDFTINEGTEQNPINIPYTGFNVDLIIPDKLVELKPNGQYNYTITIGSKSAITFEVDVQDWTPKEDIPEIEMK